MDATQGVVSGRRSGCNIDKKKEDGTRAKKCGKATVVRKMAIKMTCKFKLVPGLRNKQSRERHED